jgi:hypothetical protein
MLGSHLFRHLERLLPCSHRRWKRYDIGFDQGVCCVDCKQAMFEPECRCGRLLLYPREAVDMLVFSCSICGFYKAVPTK